jgi:protein-S-isoprenylcysteine O-methyltransferase Ste14
MSNRHDTDLRRGLDNRVPPPLVFLAIAAVMVVAANLLPSTGLGGPWARALGGALLLLAGLSGPPAIWRFGRAGTTIDPIAIERASVLVTDGVYRWTRNPMYLAMAALLGAIAVFAAQPWLVIGPVAFVLFITRFQILPEERAMRARFGADYDAYRARVRRWL